MLRECHRVLEPGGVLAGYVIHTPEGVTADEEARATTLGPACTAGFGAPAALLDAAGLALVDRRDVTRRFRDTCEALLRARRNLEAELRDEEGDATYEEEVEAKVHMLQGIDEGLLIRSLITAARP